MNNFFFFFSSRRRHTRCYRDWSSDVCSSDLAPRGGKGPGEDDPRARRPARPTPARRLPWGKELERAAIVLVLAAAVTSAVADERLGEVVVTAPSLAERRAAEDPTAFATVIETGAAPTEVKTLTDALADAVGVQVRRFGGLGDFSTVSIRGSSAGQVQIYLDGVPLSRAENETVN